MRRRRHGPHVAGRGRVCVQPRGRSGKSQFSAAKLKAAIPPTALSAQVREYKPSRLIRSFPMSPTPTDSIGGRGADDHLDSWWLPHCWIIAKKSPPSRDFLSKLPDVGKFGKCPESGPSTSSAPRRERHLSTRNGPLFRLRAKNRPPPTLPHRGDRILAKKTAFSPPDMEHANALTPRFCVTVNTTDATGE